MSPVNVDQNQAGEFFDDLDDEDQAQPMVVVEPTGCGATLCCDPYRKFYRFVALFFMCFLSFGSYFCFDNPAALEVDIKNDMKISVTDYSLLYSIYSWPNVILSLFGGYLIDRVLGIRWGTVLFAFFIAAGQIVFAFGALIFSFPLMVVGRFIFAIGGESLAVAQNTYAVKWFKGKELNTVFGIQLSFARIGSTVNLYVMKPMYDAVSKIFSGNKGLGLSLLIAGLSTVISFFCAGILAFLDKRNDKFLAIRDKKQKPEDADGVIQLRDVYEFSASMWLLCAICVAYYVAIFPLISFGMVFFISKYRLDPYHADVCNSLIYLISIVASPISGMLIDWTGRNIFWIMFSCLLTILGHIILAFTFISPYVAMALLGVAYSLLAASLWPCVAFVVPSRALATAYGLMQSIQNLGLGLLFISAGAIVDARGYLTLEIFFLAWLCLALGCTVLLWIVDASKAGSLNMSSEARKAHLAKLDEKTAKDD